MEEERSGFSKSVTPDKSTSPQWKATHLRIMGQSVQIGLGFKKNLHNIVWDGSGVDLGRVGEGRVNKIKILKELI